MPGPRARDLPRPRRSNLGNGWEGNRGRAASGILSDRLRIRWNLALERGVESHNSAGKAPCVEPLDGPAGLSEREARGAPSPTMNLNQQARAGALGAGAVVERGPRPLEIGLAQLDKECGTVHGRISELERRLEPLLDQLPPQPAPQNAQPMERAQKVAHQIQDYCKALSLASDRIASLLERLHL